MADRLDPAVATDPAPQLTADPEGEALTGTLGVSAVVRTLHELFGHPAGTLGLVIGQASNGPDRYRVMIPGNPHEYSLRARDVEVVQGIERWYQRWSRERYWRELAGVLTTEVEHLREVAAHGQTLAVEVGALREEVGYLRGQRDADGCWWRDETRRLSARLAERRAERDAARALLRGMARRASELRGGCRVAMMALADTLRGRADLMRAWVPAGPVADAVRQVWPDGARVLDDIADVYLEDNPPDDVPDVAPPVGGAGDTAPDESIARTFHEAYERLAPEYGYRTREASAKPWAEVPEQNRALMVATVREVRAALAARTATPPAGAAGMLAEFHAAFGQPFGHGSVDASDLRVSLHKEEHRELLAAYAARDLPAIAHELADVVYVAYGSAHSLGIPLDAVIAEVHRANMSKFGEDGHPVLREDGKVMKGPRYRPPDVAAVLAGRTATPPPAEPTTSEPVAVTKLRATIALLGDLSTKSLHGELGTEALSREREERVEILHELGYTLGEVPDAG